MSSSSSNSGGIGFFGFLTLIFITLKLTHVITWSWWWVLAPLWGTFIIGAIGILLLLVLLIRGKN